MVLFPNAPLPLHVFEERYKLMVQRCLDADSRFGVVLIKSGSDVGEPAEPYSVGTVARIVKVDRMDDGRMLLSVVGQSRFRIEEITQRRPYLEGRVEELEDREAGGEHPPPKEMDAIRRAASQHVSLIMGLRGGWVRNVVMPGDPAALSFLIATALQVSVAEKQSLLEAPSAAVRLQKELILLEREAEGLKERVARSLQGEFSSQ